MSAVALPSPPMSYDLERIGAAVRRARGPRSQAWLGEATGLGQAAISDIERGKVEPKLGTLARLCEVLEVDVADLVTWAGLSKGEPADVRTALLGAAELEDADREMLLGLYERLKKRGTRRPRRRPTS